MISLSDFFSPVTVRSELNLNSSQLGTEIQSYKTGFPSLSEIDIAIVGVQEGRRSLNNQDCSKAADAVREQLYTLHTGDFKPRIADLGNIKAGSSVRDTYVALENVVEDLVKNNIIPLIIGGGQDLTYAQYLGYKNLDKKINLVAIDPGFDIGNEDDEEVSSASFLNHIIMHEPGFLFNYSNIGYQTYLVNQESVRLMQKLYFDIHRLGELSGNLPEAEPIIRNADMISFDMSCIRHSDSPASPGSNPNGFYGEEACQLARYAGMSDKLSSIGFYEMNPSLDDRNRSAKLLSQMIWCFIEGYYNRKNDRPQTSKTDFTKYRATFKNSDHEVIFYKSKKTDRWWMQIPYPNTKGKNERYHIVPCTYGDYQEACSGEMPERWWKNFQKLI